MKKPKRSKIAEREAGVEGIDEQMALEAYMAMQQSIRPDATGRDFDRLCASTRVIGVARVGRDFKEAFALELRMRAQYVFEKQTGMNVADYIRHRQKKANQ